MYMIIFEERRNEANFSTFTAEHFAIMSSHYLENKE